VSSYRDATWAINKLGGSNFRNMFNNASTLKPVTQKIGTSVAEDVVF
jgi:hypothetical protein